MPSAQEQTLDQAMIGDEALPAGAPAWMVDPKVRAAAEEKATRWMRRNDAIDEGDSWALTYLDVITLLLTLFVVLMARTTLDAKSKKELVETKVETVEAQAIAKQVPHEPPATDPVTATNSIVDLGLTALRDRVEVLEIKGGVQLQIQDRILFAPGKATLKAEGYELLDQLVPVLQRNRHRITVEGHTDDVPISNRRYPSNWELSAARAASVVSHQAGGLEPPVEGHRVRGHGADRQQRAGAGAGAQPAGGAAVDGGVGGACPWRELLHLLGAGPRASGCPFVHGDQTACGRGRPRTGEPGGGCCRAPEQRGRATGQGLSTRPK